MFPLHRNDDLECLGWFLRNCKITKFYMIQFTPPSIIAVCVMTFLKHFSENTPLICWFSAKTISSTHENDLTITKNWDYSYYNHSINVYYTKITRTLPDTFKATYSYIQHSSKIWNIGILLLIYKLINKSFFSFPSLRTTFAYSVKTFLSSGSLSWNACTSLKLKSYLQRNLQ